MKILAVDTATKVCSVAVTENQTLLAELTIDHGHTHSTHLMPMIDDILAYCGLSMQALDGFAVTIGPGSFTGLRIGVSTVKGLAFSVSKPVAGVSVLEALAYQFPFAAYPICPMIDARKGEVYAGGYAFVDGELAQLWPAAALDPESAIATMSMPCLFVGSGARLYKDLISEVTGGHASFAPAGQDYTRAATVGMLGRQLIRRQQDIPPARLNPCYIRPSDAEKAFSKVFSK